MTITSHAIRSPSAPRPPTPGFVPLAGVWRVSVLGTLEARNGDMLLTHFISQPIATLLARLALQPQRIHPREELVDLLWPGVDLAVGRNRLRNAISSLRRLLEPPGVAAGSVLVADRQSIQLAPDASVCDALEFESAVRSGQHAQARELYRGELLPGFYDDWVQDERARLAAVFERLSGEVEREARPLLVALPSATAAVPTTVPTTAPAISPWQARQPTLPAYLTRLFGREAERDGLGALLDRARLVTLSGTGGCGKTRLAVEVARVTAGFDCVAFAALADCRNAVDLTAQLRVALQLPKAAGDPLDQVVAMLGDRRPLLVLDNFEQLVRQGGPAVVEALLERVPALHVLVTSRRVLGLAGEHEFPLAPLPRPDPAGSVGEVAQAPSVALFVDRARSVRPDFQVTARNHEALAALCQALEGLPLAIELAASRSRAFSPSDMHAALAQRFSLLVRGGALAGKSGARHDSLRAAIDWSWALLQPAQQRFLMALSVFRGGWSARHAEAVSDETDAHALLESLTADSLLRSEADASGAMRFFMFEMVREYLHEHLAPSDAQRLRQRHRAHFLAQALVLGQRAQAAPRDELPNFLEALQTAVDDGEPALALALGVALRGEWEQHGMPPQAEALLERALVQHAARHSTEADGGQGANALRAHAHLVLRAALLVAGRCDAAQDHATNALALAGTQPGPRAAALLGQARQHWERSRAAHKMRPLLAEALPLARRERALETEAGVLATMALLVFQDEDKPAEAVTIFDEAERVYEAAGIDHKSSRMLFMKAVCHAKLHHRGEALALLDECERRFVALGDVAALPELANTQAFVYSYMLRWRDDEQACARCALGAARHQNLYMMSLGLWNLPRPLAHQRLPERAARMMAFAERYWVSHFGDLVPSDRRYVQQVRRLIRVQIGTEAMERAWAQAASMTLADALAIAAQSLEPVA